MNFPFPDFDTAFWALATIILLGGVVRGFAGFGTALIVVPLASIFMPVKTVLVAILIADTFPMLPLIYGALAKVTVRPLLSVYAGYLLAMPFGIWVLLNADPTNLRWFISAVVFAACLLLWSGWRYHGPRNLAVRGAVGAVSGFLGGSTGMNGPPVVLYWMSQESRSANVRANLIVFFGLTEIAGFTLFWWNGLLTGDRIMTGLFICPFYFAGLMLGARLFGKASDESYRQIAYVLILAAAIIGLPIWQG